MRKMKWKLTMQKSTKIAPDDLGEDVDLNEEDDEFSDDDSENIEE